MSGAMSMQVSKFSETLSELRHGLIVQGRVIGALMLREIHTINGNSQLGYLWALIQSLFSIAILAMLRQLLGASQGPHGMSMVLFLATGLGVWSVFSGGVVRCMNAVEGNKALLTFPQVTELDVMIARVIVVAATQVVTMCIIVAIVQVVLGQSLLIGNLSLLLILLVLIPLLTLGCGMILSSLAVFMPVLNKLIPMVLRIMFFATGIFFSVSVLSESVAEILLLNPVLQAIELLRISLYEPYEVPDLSLGYVASFAVASCAFGGCLERYVRTRRRDE